MRLEVSDLSCGYQKDKPVLRHVGFELQSGDICCILGQNGVGKSTLFKTLLRLIPPLEGRILIDGSDITRWSRSKLAGTAAYVAQSSDLVFPYLAEELIMMGRMNHMGPFGAPGRKDYEVVDQIIDELDIGHLRGKPCMEISGGERQMVMIAQAMAQQPALLVLDEPTANLDYGNKIVVMETLKRLARDGLCVIFTSHDPEHALLLEARTALIVPGEPTVFGQAGHVVTQDNLLRAYRAHIRVVEIADGLGRPIRVCLPQLNT